jgi:hypothetical protein
MRSKRYRRTAEEETNPLLPILVILIFCYGITCYEEKIAQNREFNQEETVYE